MLFKWCYRPFWEVAIGRLNHSCDITTVKYLRPSKINVNIVVSFIISDAVQFYPNSCLELYLYFRPFWWTHILHILPYSFIFFNNSFTDGLGLNRDGCLYNILYLFIGNLDIAESILPSRITFCDCKAHDWNEECEEYLLPCFHLRNGHTLVSKSLFFGSSHYGYILYWK